MASRRPASELDLLQEIIEQLNGVRSDLAIVHLVHLEQGRQTELLDQILHAIKAS